VVTPAGEAVTTSDFIVTGPGPIIDDFSPTVGAPGTEVLVYGANFTNVAAVTFNKVAAAEFSVPAPTQIRARSAPNATTGKIAITTSRGSVTSVVDFVVTRAPVITGFTPRVGRDGFTQVTLEGVNFTELRGVGFNGKPTTGWATPAANQVLVTVPTGATTGRITITNASGYGVSTNDFVITLAPIIDSFHPTNAAWGASMWVSGVNLSNGFTVLRFNGVNASFQVTGQNGTQIQATVPANATTGPLTMTNAYGSVTTSNNFFVTGSAPYVTDVSPDRGPRGTRVTLTGGNFTAPATVKFNGVPDPTAAVTALTQIQAVAPPGVLTGPVTVTTAAGTSTNGPVYYGPPRLTTIAPAEGVVGETIVLNGTNFTGTSAVWIGALSTAFTVTASNRISLVIPPQAVTGAITLATPGGAFIATNVLKVLPRITGFTPALGPAGTVVTIQGTTLRNVSAVTFNNIAATTFTTNVGMTEVRATVPAAAATGPIRVTTPDGTAVSSSSFLVTRDTDLALRKAASATLVQPGERLTFTLVASNLGPSVVTGVRVTDTLPSGLSPVTASADRGACGITNGMVTCDVGSLTNGTAVTVSIAALAEEEGMWSNRASITAVEGDPVPGNNADQVLVTVSSVASRRLSVRPTRSADGVVLSWPVSPVPFVLQSIATLPPTSPWTNVPTPPFVVGGQNVVTSPVGELRLFYRLKGP
jgi:uncharacterized repeat protein (TIGR01451 family)